MAKRSLKTQLNYQALCEAMVATQIAGRGITAPNILAAFRQVPRHLFVQEGNQRLAYGDFPLPIGAQQTISQPYIVARMLWLLELNQSDTVLEIGTGSGYQTALLSLLCHFVYSIELDMKLARSAEERLHQLGYQNIEIHPGDGQNGLIAYAPFDKMIAACAVPTLPTSWIKQLKNPGISVAPVGNAAQQILCKIKKNMHGETILERDIACVFVPLL